VTGTTVAKLILDASVVGKELLTENAPEIMRLLCSGLPKSDPGTEGAVWVDGGTVKVSQATAPDVWIIILAGESNSRGYGLNSDLSGAELNARNLLIWNRETDVWEASDIDTNSFSVTPGTDHGLEVGLANYDDYGAFGSYDVRLLKAGSGGSHIRQWTGSSETLRTQMFGWSDEAAAALPGDTIRYLFWWSQGINDSIGTSYPALTATEWKSQTIQFFGEVRTKYGPMVPIVCTELPATYSAYNTALAEIATEMTGVYIADNSGAELRDTNHWSANGLKTLVPRMLAPLVYHDPQFVTLGPIITQPTDETVEEGGNATFHLTATALTTITYQWQRSTNSGSTWSNVSGATSASLDLTAVALSADGYQYHCLVTALGYTRTSNAAELTVTAAASYDPSVDLAAKLIGWWRADSLTYQDMGGTTTAATSQDDPVKTWSCKIGSGNAAANETNNGDTGIQRFLLDLAVANGQPGLKTTSNNVKIKTVNSYTAKSVIVVAKYDGAAVASWDFPGLIGQFGSNAESLIGGAIGSTAFLGSPFLSSWSYYKNGALDGTRQMPLNAVGIVEMTGSTAFTDNLVIGYHRGANDFTWRGWIFEVLILNDQLTAGERTALCNYAASRYGFSL